MFKYLIPCIIILMICQSSLHAQNSEHKTLYDFRLYKGTSGDRDVTEWLLEKKMHTVFYLYESDSTYMLANTSYNSEDQSYGRIKYNKEPETGYNIKEEETYIYYFDWEYFNTYDDESGIAKVKAIITFKPDATYLVLSIMPNDFNMLTYYGVIDKNPDL